MQVTVRLFAGAREVAGWERRAVDLPDDATIEDILALLRPHFSSRASLLESSALAVNQRYARREVTLRDGDEVAVLPPVSGG